MLQHLKVIPLRYLSIKHCRDLTRSRHGLDQDFLSFAVKLRRKQTDSRDIAAGVRQGILLAPPLPSLRSVR